MPYSNNIITAPVSIKDIQDALGISSNDLATLVNSDKINIWAKFKPVHLLNRWHTTDQWNYDNNRWKTEEELGDIIPWFHGSPDGTSSISTYGLIPFESGSIETIVAKYNEIDIQSDSYDAYNGWRYNRPKGKMTGNNVSPYRMQDFAGYKQNAIFASEFICTYTMTSEGVTLRGNIKTSEDEYSVSPSIILPNAVFGIALYNTSGTLIRSVFNPSIGTTSVTETVVGLQSDVNYKVYPIFKIISGENTMYYSIPQTTYTTIKIQETADNFYVNARYGTLSSVTDKRTVYLSIKNDNTTDVYYYIEFRSANDDLISSYGTANEYKTIENGQTETKMLTFSADVERCKLYYKFNTLDAYRNRTIYIQSGSVDPT